MIEIGGESVKVGRISEAGFVYDTSYLSRPDAKPISISLPLQEVPFSPQKTKCFFDGLLPEGFTRRTVAQWMHVSEDDYLSILAGLGRECLGAIRIGEESDVATAQYQKLTLPQVQALAAEGTTQSAKLVTESHLSLTGASGKVGLYYDAVNDAWYQPFGTAPSTHIVKQSHVRLSGIVVNELLCLQTAKKCGIDVPDCFILDTGGAADENILFATARFDRKMVANGRELNGLPCPSRLSPNRKPPQNRDPPQNRLPPPDRSNPTNLITRTGRYSSPQSPSQSSRWRGILSPMFRPSSLLQRSHRTPAPPSRSSSSA